MGRKTKTAEQRRQAKRELAHLEQITARANLDLAATQVPNADEVAAAIEAEEAFDGRDFLTGQAIPGRVLPASSPLDGLRREADRLDAIAEKMAERVKFSGAHVRTTALHNVKYAEAEAHRARERLWEREENATDYGTLQPCRNIDCPNEIDSRSADYDTFGWCVPCYRIATGASRS